jgi:small subunit ribosomal protein S15
MYLTKEIKENRTTRRETNTGKQKVKLFTFRITHLTEHLKKSSRL